MFAFPDFLADHSFRASRYNALDEGADDAYGKVGGMHLDYGLAWQKGLTITQGQCPVKRYNQYVITLDGTQAHNHTHALVSHYLISLLHNRHLMNAIYAGRLDVAKFLNPVVIGLDAAPAAYMDFSDGAALKYVIDPHHMLPKSVVKAAVGTSAATSSH